MTLTIAWFLCVGRQNLYYKKSNVYRVYSGKLEKDWEKNALCSVYIYIILANSRRIQRFGCHFHLDDAYLDRQRA